MKFRAVAASHHVEYLLVRQSMRPEHVEVLLRDPDRFARLIAPGFAGAQPGCHAASS